MKVRPAALDDVLHICANMREINRAEIACSTWDDVADDPGQLAVLMLSAPYQIALLVLCRDDGLPVAIAGAWLIAPGVAVLRLIATDEWLTLKGAAYRWLRRVFWPCVLAPNVRRAETRVLDRGAAARKWLKGLGFVEEGIARRLGRNGEDFVHIAWINPEWR